MTSILKFYRPKNSDLVGGSPCYLPRVCLLKRNISQYAINAVKKGTFCAIVFVTIAPFFSLSFHLQDAIKIRISRWRNQLFWSSVGKKDNKTHLEKRERERKVMRTVSNNGGNPSWQSWHATRKKKWKEREKQEQVLEKKNIQNCSQCCLQDCFWFMRNTFMSVVLVHTKKTYNSKRNV